MTVRHLFILIFGLALFVMPVRETLDPDMGWHLKTGEYILEHGIPHQDVFSFTVPDREWITHEWLSDVFMALFYRTGGLPALIVVFAGIVALTFWLVYVRCVGRPYLAAFATLLGALVSAGTWGVRPQMFNMLGLAAFVNIVEGVKDKKLKRRAFLLLPVIMVVWANLHSGYLLGIVLLGTYAVGEALRRRFGPPNDRGLDWVSIRWLVAITTFCFGVAVLNPNGYRLWIYPFETLGSNAMQTYIQEWKSPNFHLPVFWPFGIMLVIGSISLMLSHMRPTWSDMLLFFGTGVAGLVSARHIQIFAVVAVPIVARHALSAFAHTRFYPLLQGTQSPSTPTRAQAAFHWGVAALLVLLAFVKIGDTMLKNDKAIAALYPVEAVNFLEQEDSIGPLGYNNYNWGGYLIWRGIPVFVDGRADVYMDEFLLYYMQAYQAKPDWQEPLYDFDVDYVLMERDTPLTVLLAERDDWREVYRDDVAQIFARTSESRLSDTDSTQQ
jgi:hypothetical protein